MSGSSRTLLYTLASTELSLLRQIETRRRRTNTFVPSRSLSAVRSLMAYLEKKLDKQREYVDDDGTDSFKLNWKYTECAICMEDFKEGESCRILSQCKHVFHPNCIYIWLKKQHACPICRRSTSIG